MRHENLSLQTREAWEFTCPTRPIASKKKEFNMKNDSLASYEREIPLFPLQVVLFPGGILPLHIFEQRYREMIKFCLEHESEFGVILIKEGAEVDEPVTPYKVGTAVRIRDVEHLPDGRMNIMTSGEYRFEILEALEHQPYLVGRVQLLDSLTSEVDPALAAIAAEIEDLYEAYELLSSRLIFGWHSPEENPVHPRELAYQIATRLRISLEEKQGLLETVPLTELLTREIEILKKENRRISFRLMARNN